MLVQLLLSTPPLLLLVVAAAPAAAFAVGGHMYVRRRFRDVDFPDNNEVAGHTFAVAGALYAVILGFFTAIAWEHYAEAHQLVSRESSAAANAWHTAVGLPDAARSALRNDVLAYAGVMVAKEWPAMRRGSGGDPEADAILMHAFGAVGTAHPADLGTSNAQNTTLQQLAVLHEVRQHRLAVNDGAVTWFEWVVLLLGAACTIAFCWAFGLRNTGVHRLMTGAVAILVSSTLVLLFELEYPFRSGMSTGVDEWPGVIQHIGAMEMGPQQNMRSGGGRMEMKM